jgi:hypothetical protein
MAILAVLGPPRCVQGAEPSAGSPDNWKVEAWAGADYVSHVWSLYTGATWAPGGVHQDGWRLRAVGGYGAYSYRAGSQIVRAEKPFADALLGYQIQAGAVTLKLFGGGTFADAHGDPADPDKLGGKAVLETWWTFSDRAWSSLDIAASTIENDSSARLRLGWRMQPSLSVGIEAGTTGFMRCHGICNDARAGSFVRYEWDAGEISISGGLANDTAGTAVRHLSEPFATVNWLTRF